MIYNNKNKNKKSGDSFNIGSPILLKLFLHKLVLHGRMNKSSLFLVLYECIPELVAKRFKFDFI
jgi:hypothetical protein